MIRESVTTKQDVKDMDCEPEATTSAGAGIPNSSTQPPLTSLKSFTASNKTKLLGRDSQNFLQICNIFPNFEVLFQSCYS